MKTDRSNPYKLEPGMLVAYTGKFLKSCGLYTGPAGQEKFTIQYCSCRMCKVGQWVAIDQIRTECDPKSRDYDAEYLKDLLAEGGSTWRHIAVFNLYRVGTLDHRNAD
jgi:hypothetical protein